MDKTLADFLFDDIENDQFLLKYFSKLLLDYSKSIVNNEEAVYSNEYRSLLRYADMLSLSNDEKHHNFAEQIVILLSHLFPFENEVNIFKRNI